MIWTAIVPIKPFEEAKTRLSLGLSSDERSNLARDMFCHVTGVLGAHPLVGRLVIVSRSEIADCPGEWFQDPGHGLNPALEAARAAFGAPCAIFHADLPLLVDSDVSALLEAGERSGSALAPDRHDRGTNAIALGQDAPFRLRFGEDSFSRHLEQSCFSGAVVRTNGLGQDCDTMEDFVSYTRVLATQ